MSQPSNRDEARIAFEAQFGDIPDESHEDFDGIYVEWMRFHAGWDACQEHSRQVDEEKLFTEMCSMASKNQGVGEKNATYKNGWWDCWQYVKRSLRGE